MAKMKGERLGVSIIILAFNRCEDVLFTLKMVKEQKLKTTLDLEIIVVDNGSTDKTEARIKAEHPDVIYLKQAVNVGIAGWNSGFAISQYRYLLVLDDDSHIEDGLQEAVAYMESSADVGILALNITTGKYATNLWENGTQTIGFIGCGAIICRSVYKTIGGFADWIYVSGHEWEYGIRAIDAGFKIVYFKNSSVIHRSGAQLARDKRTITYSTRNELAIIYKYFKTNRMKFLIRVFLNNFKMVRSEGYLSGFYSLIGAMKFLKLSFKLQPTPVHQHTQDFFSAIFWGTQPSFDFLRKVFYDVNRSK